MQAPDSSNASNRWLYFKAKKVKKQANEHKLQRSSMHKKIEDVGIISNQSVTSKIK